MRVIHRRIAELEEEIERLDTEYWTLKRLLEKAVWINPVEHLIEELHRMY